MSGRIEEFRERDCEILSVSTDTIETHERWLTTPPDQGGLGHVHFDLGSDSDGTICQQYGVYVEKQHVALRGLFIIDSNGVLQYQLVHSLSVGRSSEEILRVIEALQSGGLCPGERELGQLPMDVLNSLGPNRVIGQYQIESQLGSGAFGTVFRAKDILLNRPVALKVLRENFVGQKQESLLGEARAAAALSHPNVCTVHAIDTSNGAEMIVMEYVEGRPLSDWLKSGPLPADQVIPITRQIAAGMSAAHSAGVVHGDLKPANLMVNNEGAVKVMDFGLARQIVSDRWHADTMVPTGSYRIWSVWHSWLYVARSFTRCSADTGQ